MRAGLTVRLGVASGVLAVVVAGAFTVLLSSVSELRDLQQRANRAEQLVAIANHAERLVVDLETGQRGFIITGEESFLQPWWDARAAIPQQLGQLVADNPDEQAAAIRISQAITDYLNNYSIPLVNTARQDPAAARTNAITDEGKRRMDAIRAELDHFLATETTLASQRQDQAAAVDHRASLGAAAGLAGSVLLIALFAGYLTWAIARPVRRAAAMAGRIAGGDLDTRLAERGPGEIGALQRSFNTMARSLGESRAELAASRARIVARGRLRTQTHRARPARRHPAAAGIPHARPAFGRIRTAGGLGGSAR